MRSPLLSSDRHAVMNLRIEKKGRKANPPTVSARSLKATAAQGRLQRRARLRRSPLLGIRGHGPNLGSALGQIERMALGAEAGAVTAVFRSVPRIGAGITA